MRLFIALPLDAALVGPITRLQSGLDGAKWSPAENLHLTLRFVGDIAHTQAQDLDVALAAIRRAPFDVSLMGAGFFGHQEPHSVWLGVKDNSHLIALHQACERACRQIGLVGEARAFKPHVTVCYLPRGQALEPVLAYQSRHALFEAGPWRADRFYLYSSHPSKKGPSHYSIEAEYPLIG